MESAQFHLKITTPEQVGFHFLKAGMSSFFPCCVCVCVCVRVCVCVWILPGFCVFDMLLIVRCLENFILFCSEFVLLCFLVERAWLSVVFSTVQILETMFVCFCF